MSEFEKKKEFRRGEEKGGEGCGKCISSDHQIITSLDSNVLSITMTAAGKRERERGRERQIDIGRERVGEREWKREREREREGGGRGGYTQERRIGGENVRKGD